MVNNDSPCFKPGECLCAYYNNSRGFSDRVIQCVCSKLINKVHLNFSMLLQHFDVGISGYQRCI